MGLILLLIVVACVALLIYFNKKSKSLDEEFEAKVDVSGASHSTSTLDSKKKEEEKPSGPPLITIYEFSPKVRTRVCPFCDGENNIGIKTCHICGRDI